MRSETSFDYDVTQDTAAHFALKLAGTILRLLSVIRKFKLLQIWYQSKQKISENIFI